MREYKFRGRSIEPLVGDDQWLYGFGVHVVELTDGGKEYWLYTDNGPHQVDPVTVGQYTGRKDCNRKEIYEGDIGNVLIGRYSNPKKPFLAVVTCDECFWSYWEVERDVLHEIWPDDYFEVLGNIHDNATLLEGVI